MKQDSVRSVVNVLTSINAVSALIQSFTPLESKHPTGFMAEMQKESVHLLLRARLKARPF